MNKILAGTLIIVAGLFLFSASSVLAQGEPCNADFDFDRDVDAINVNSFLEEFGRSQFNNPCPPDGPSRVPKTGQWRSDTPKDDGDRRWGVPWPNPRFTDNDNGTVTDNLTGLIWLKNANCPGLQTWEQAVLTPDYYFDGVCGLTDDSSAGDWRLPNRNELNSLLHLGNTGFTLPDTVGTAMWSEGDPFIDVQPDYYWTSTTVSFSTTQAWRIHIGIGDVGRNFKTEPHSVWPVKGGYDYQEGPF